MPEHTFQPDSADHTRRPVSLRFVLFVLLGLYLAGYLAYRLSNEPPDYQWGAFRYSNSTLSDYVRPFTSVWESDELVAMKVFHTFYSPCYMAEEWLIFEILT
jgi:hypothetical protein